MNGSVEKHDLLLEELASARAAARAYSKILEKYSEYINNSEFKTVPQLKKLINPNDLGVLKVKRVIEEQLKSKSQERVHLFQSFFYFVSSLKNLGLSSSVSFWFTPSEVLEIGGADVFDKCIFMACLLAASGEKPVIAVFLLENAERRPVVKLQLSSKVVYFDFVDKVSIKVEKEEELKKIKEKQVIKTLFDFSQDEYNEYD